MKNRNGEKTTNSEENSKQVYALQKNKPMKFNIKSAILLIACATLIQIDWFSLFGLGKTDNRSVIISEVKDELKKHKTSKDFLMEEYKTAVKEIQTRLDHEKIYYMLKFSLVGAVLALLFTTYSREKEITFQKFRNNQIAACFCWAAVLASALVDTRILNNQNFIILGKFFENDKIRTIYLDFLWH